MVNPRQVVRAIFLALLLPVFLAASASMAYGQFTLTVLKPLSPAAVDPGGSSNAILDLEGSGGPVSFNTIPCTVTPVPTTGAAPLCGVGTDSATPPAQVPVNITTSDTTPPGLYNITVTGTSGSASQVLTLTLTVVDLTEDYTLSVAPTTATPSPVAAGGQATAVVTVTPIGNYGSANPPHQVTLSCLSVTPVVVGAPVCSFTSPTGNPYVIVSGTAPTATLIITTYGTATTTHKLSIPRVFYALWLAVPGLALAGVGAAGARRKKLMGLLLLMAMASGLLLLPSCNSTNNTNSPTGQITPSDTYTFTLTGTDENGVAPSNTTTDEATVTLAVN
jgi:hypothetical protein